MKKFGFITAFIMFALLGTFVSKGLQKIENEKGQKSETVLKNNKKIVIEKNDIKVKMMPEDHSRKSFNCKSCHNCEYPTKQNPCLKDCPRNVISVYHSPDEGPDVLTLTKLSDRYGKVVFSHKIHAQMAEMAGGCTSCHHYNTTGPVLNCKNCHKPRAERVDITVPDLEAAYHRQCMQCHRQWNRSTNCYSCHLPKDKKDKELQVLADKLKRAAHPELPRPVKVVYETRSEKGKYVTFFHDEHTILFNISCKSCHHDENCSRCHNVVKTAKIGNSFDQHKKVHKSFDRHHRPCIACHDSKKCDKCHKQKEMSPFNHAITVGWDLGKMHSKLSCIKCHQGNKFTSKKSSCNACHKKFTPDKFDHNITGLDLDDNHQELDCVTCHEENNFKVMRSKCLDCHDEMLNPDMIPGKKVSALKKMKSKK